MYRGYTGHEHLYGFVDVPGLDFGDYYACEYIVRPHDAFNLINMNGRLYDPVNGRMLSVDNYVQESLGSQGYNRYSYAGNNPLKYTDPSGEFLTWSISASGFSIGLNFTPVGVPLGFGVNVGFGSGQGLSLGGYGEVGYRLGGTGFGAGATISQSLAYNFKQNTWNATSTAGVYKSFGLLNIGASISNSYDFESKQWTESWGVSAGIGLGGNGNSGVGMSVSYGSSGWGLGIGGYYQKPKTPQITQPKNDKGGTRNTGIVLGKSKWDLLTSGVNESIGLGLENSYPSICDLEFENCREIAYNDATKDFLDSVWDNTLKGAAVGAGVGWLGGPILEGVTITGWAAVGGGSAFFLRGYFSY